MSLRLVVISPCRDEAAYIENTLSSVVAQTHRPSHWVVVDDGSSDDTAAIVNAYAQEHAWIRLVRRRRSGGRELGPGVVAAFNTGLEQLGDEPYDVIAKLDCDLAFEPECFAEILALFANAAVGMASATVKLVAGRGLTSERFASYHVPGQAKFYRRTCFEQIGGLPNLYGWDILDETEARRHGWMTVSDPRIVIRHLRRQGKALGLLRGRTVWGYTAWAIGSHPMFAVARALYRMVEPPWIIGGTAFLWGFFTARFQSHVSRNPDPQSIAYLRREQLYRMLHWNRLPPEFMPTAHEYQPFG